MNQLLELEARSWLNSHDDRMKRIYYLHEIRRDVDAFRTAFETSIRDCTVGNLLFARCRSAFGTTENEFPVSLDHANIPTAPIAYASAIRSALEQAFAAFPDENDNGSSDGPPNQAPSPNSGVSRLIRSQTVDSFSATTIA